MKSSARLQQNRRRWPIVIGFAKPHFGIQRAILQSRAATNQHPSLGMWTTRISVDEQIHWLAPCCPIPAETTPADYPAATPPAAAHRGSPQRSPARAALSVGPGPQTARRPCSWPGPPWSRAAAIGCLAAYLSMNGTDSAGIFLDEGVWFLPIHPIMSAEARANRPKGGRPGARRTARKRPRRPRDRVGDRSALYRRVRQPGDGGVGEGLVTSTHLRPRRQP